MNASKYSRQFKFIKKLALKQLPVLIAIAGLSSCAAFPKHALPDASSIKGSASESRKKNTNYQFTSATDLGKGRKERAANEQNVFETEFVSAMNETGCFSSVSKGKGGSLSISVDCLEQGNGSAAYASGFISGLSVGVIPGMATSNFKVTANVTNASGVRKEYVLEDSATLVIWLPLAVVSPFANPITVCQNVRKNMYFTVVQRMQQDGLLK